MRVGLFSLGPEEVCGGVPAWQVVLFAGEVHEGAGNFAQGLCGGGLAAAA